MLTRLILRLPWFASVPMLLFGAIVLATGLNFVAGSYFERTFRDDADPFLGAAVPASSTGIAAAPVVAQPAAVPPAVRAEPTPASAPAEAAVPAPAVAPAPVAAAAPTAAPAPVAVPPPAAMSAQAAPVRAAPVAQVSGPILLAEGAFVDGDPGHNADGSARLIRTADGRHVVRFEDFSVTNGPDLFVIFSTDPAGGRASAAAADALNLGRLKATNGNINYDIPDGTDLSNFHSVIIYCRAFRVVFAVATLEAR